MRRIARTSSDGAASSARIARRGAMRTRRRRGRIGRGSTPSGKGHAGRSSSGRCSSRRRGCGLRRLGRGGNGNVGADYDGAYRNRAQNDRRGRIYRRGSPLLRRTPPTGPRAGAPTLSRTVSTATRRAPRHLRQASGATTDSAHTRKEVGSCAGGDPSHAGCRNEWRRAHVPDGPNFLTLAVNGRELAHAFDELQTRGFDAFGMVVDTREVGSKVASMISS